MSLAILIDRENPSDFDESVDDCGPRTSASSSAQETTPMTAPGPVQPTAEIAAGYPSIYEMQLSPDERTSSGAVSNVYSERSYRIFVDLLRDVVFLTVVRRRLTPAGSNCQVRCDFRVVPVGQVDEPLLFEPGAQRRYSNAGYIVLGLVIEKLTGQDHYTYVREHVFLPAGMENTDSYPMDAVTPNLATGYTHLEDDNGAWISNIYTAPGRGSSAGGGYSTVEDMHKFILALRGGKLLSSKYTAWMLMGDLPATNPALPLKRGNIGIAGGAPGINGAVEYDVETGNIVIVLSNYDPLAAENVARKIRGWMKRFVED